MTLYVSHMCWDSKSTLTEMFIKRWSVYINDKTVKCWLPLNTMAAEAPITAKNGEYAGADILQNTQIISNTAENPGFKQIYESALSCEEVKSTTECGTLNYTDIQTGKEAEQTPAPAQEDKMAARQKTSHCVFYSFPYPYSANPCCALIGSWIHTYCARIG